MKTIFRGPTPWNWLKDGRSKESTEITRSRFGSTSVSQPIAIELNKFITEFRRDELTQSVREDV